MQQSGDHVHVNTRSKKLSKIEKYSISDDDGNGIALSADPLSSHVGHTITKVERLRYEFKAETELEGGRCATLVW